MISTVPILWLANKSSYIGEKLCWCKYNCKYNIVKQKKVWSTCINIFINWYFWVWMYPQNPCSILDYLMEGVKNIRLWWLILLCVNKIYKNIHVCKQGLMCKNVSNLVTCLSLGCSSRGLLSFKTQVILIDIIALYQTTFCTWPITSFFLRESLYQQLILVHAFSLDSSVILWQGLHSHAHISTRTNHKCTYTSCTEDSKSPLVWPSTVYHNLRTGKYEKRKHLFCDFYDHEIYIVRGNTHQRLQLSAYETGGHTKDS